MSSNSGSEKSPVSIGLIGVGGYGARHLDVIRQLEKTGHARLLAVADPTLDRLPDVREALTRAGVRLHADYRRMLAEESALEAVGIAAPIPFHFDMAQACMERGLFIYLEKPPVPLLDQLERLIELDRDRRVAVGFQMVTSRWSQTIKGWIRDGTLGDVTEIRAVGCWPRADSYYRRAGWAGRMMHGGEPIFDGPATNAFSHLIHNAMFFTAEPGAEFATPLDIQAELYRARPIESYDVACLRSRLSSGATFFTALSHATDQELAYQVEVIGTKGWARASDDGRRLESSRGETLDIAEDTMVNSYSAFFQYVRGETPRPPTLLGDCAGYVLATNGSLLSAGGVCRIGPKWVRKTPGDTVYVVEGLHAATAEALRSPCLFSESGLPWAAGTDSVSLEDFGPGRSREVRSLLQKAADEFRGPPE